MDPIALGTLIVAVLGLLAGGIKALYSFVLKRTKAHFEVEKYSEGPFYVNQIRYSINNKRGSISSVATWVKVRLINATSSPILITKLEVLENRRSRRKPVSLPFQNGEINGDVAKVSEVLRLPFRIDSQDGKDFFILIDVRIPKKIGAILFDLYCKNIDLNKIEKNIQDLRENALKEVQKDISIIKFVGFEIPEVSISAPIVTECEDKYSVAPTFGLVPYGAGLRLVNTCAERGIPYPREKVPSKYILEISLGDGRNLKKIFKTKKNPMWFMKYNQVKG